MPKGTLRGSPALPDDDLTTLRVPLYLVASKKVSDDVAGALAKAVFEAKRELASEHPLLAQIAQPDKEKDAFIPIHPGASQYFEGEQKSFFDKYGDQFFYGSMLLGMLTSMLAGVWKYMSEEEPEPQERPLSRLFALMDRVRDASDEADLAKAEQEIDDILRSQLETCAPGEIDAGEAAAVSLATHRLEHLVSQRRAALRSQLQPCASARRAGRAGAVGRGFRDLQDVANRGLTLAGVRQCCDVAGPVAQRTGRSASGNPAEVPQKTQRYHGPLPAARPLAQRRSRAGSTRETAGVSGAPVCAPNNSKLMGFP